MTYGSAIQAAQLIADELPGDCERSIEPPQGNEGGCIVCDRPPAGRLVLRKDGEDIAWVSTCTEHGTH